MSLGKFLTSSLYHFQNYLVDSSITQDKGWTDLKAYQRCLKHKNTEQIFKILY